MKNILLPVLILLCSTTVSAQKKSRFNTVDKNSTKSEIKWNGSFSYGTTLFIGDLNQFSSEKYLPNVALAIKFNKEFNTKSSLQLAVIAGKSTGENNFEGLLPLQTFRAQYLKSYLAFRRAISPLENKKGKTIPQLHLVIGAGYYYGNTYNTNYINPDEDLLITLHQDVWSFVFPTGLELSYYIQDEWGAVISVTNNLFNKDTIDLYKNSSNGPDHQLIINLGLCYKFN